MALDNNITDNEAAALVRATVGLAARWGLTDHEARTLLGGLSKSTWTRWKQSKRPRVNRDLRTRMAVLMGIHKGLRYLFADPARDYAWIRKPNARCHGESALDIMLRGEIADLIGVRNLLDREEGF